MHNPYQAPTSTLAEIPHARPGRPFAVWLLLIMLGVMAAITVLGFIRTLWALAFHDVKVNQPFALLFIIGAYAALLAATVGGVIGVFRRKRWGRWLGLAVLLILPVSLFFIPDTTQYASDAERWGGFVGRNVLIPLLMSWWAYLFGFSQKAGRYFADQRKRD